MKAFVHSQYGSPDVLQLKEVEKPVPKDNEVLIKIRAVSINGSDREGLIGKPLYARMRGLRRPNQQILGSDIAGMVEATGGDITELKVGDEVFGELPGYQGGFAEYACATERTLVRIPAGMTREEAAAIPQGGVIALRAICKEGDIQPGQKVLINGAGGSAGCYAVQLAKLRGAEVTGVDNRHKMDFLRSLGADHVIDYTRQNFTRNGKQYDFILDPITHRSVFAYQRALRRGGTYYTVGGSVATFFQILLFGPWIKRATGKNLRILMVPQNRQDLISFIELYQAGRLRPIVDRVYPFHETPAAMRYVTDGLARGKVVIQVEQEG